MERLTEVALTVDVTRGKIVQAALAAQVGMAKLCMEQNERITRLVKMQATLEEDLADNIETGMVRVRVKVAYKKPGRAKNSTITQTRWEYVERELSLDERMSLLTIVNRSVEVLMSLLEKVNKPVVDFPGIERFLREVESMQLGDDGTLEMQKFFDGLPPEMAKEIDRQLRARLQGVVDAEFTEVN